jgi:hypothetical protein
MTSPQRYAGDRKSAGGRCACRKAIRLGEREMHLRRSRQVPRRVTRGVSNLKTQGENGDAPRIPPPQNGRNELFMQSQCDGSAPRDHEPRRLAERRSAAGMSRRRFDLKVEWDTSIPSFGILFSNDLRKTSPAIPTCGYRQAP